MVHCIMFCSVGKEGVSRESAVTSGNVDIATWTIAVITNVQLKGWRSKWEVIKLENRKEVSSSFKKNLLYRKIYYPE